MASDANARQQQSQIDREKNAEQIDGQVKSKLDAGAAPTQEEARLAESREHRATGRVPESGSVAAQAQSAVDKQTNLEHAEQHIKSKLEAGVAPTKDEANHAESREHRATGTRPEPGSIAAQAKSVADKHANYEQAEKHVEAELESGITPSQQEARIAESREHRATGHYPEPGSTISKAQSAADKAANFDAAAEEIHTKLEKDPSSITSADAAHLESREARVAGHNPPSDSIAAKSKSIAAANEGATNTQTAKAHEFEEAVNIIAPKIAHEPEHITDEDANLLHSTDRRAHGTVEKGGITAQAQHLAAENKGATKSQTS